MRKVSVLIPLYNGEEFIEEAIESVLKQTFTDFELIVVDNCSTDKSFEKIQKYKADPRVKLFQNEYNVGLNKNWNICLLYGKGEYIKFLCADDYFEDVKMLSDFVQVMEDNPDVSLVFAPRMIKDFKGNFTSPKPYFTGKRNGKEVLDDVIKNHLNPIGEPTSVMFRRKHLYIGLFSVDIKWAIDIDYWLRLCGEGNVFGLSKHYAVFRMNELQGTQEARNSGKFLQEEKNYIYYNYFIRNSGVQRNRKLYLSSQQRQLFNNIRWGTINYSQAMSYLNVFPFFYALPMGIYISAFYTGRFFKRKIFNRS